MRVAMVSVPARPGRTNEDVVAATPTAAVLVDGAGIPGTESICRHGVAWYAAQLGARLLALVSLARDRSLTTLLADAIEQVTNDHRSTCDVANPISPSAAVAALRVSDHDVEYLVLGDATLVLDRSGHPPWVITDPRELIVRQDYLPALAATTEGSDEYHRIVQDLRNRRNRPGGFWVAKDDPRAAEEAVTGRAHGAELRGAGLFSNGASRVVDRFHLADWAQVISLLHTSGPAEIIRRVRQAEDHHAVPADDASIAHCTELG